jgi:hypothetical protein
MASVSSHLDETHLQDKTASARQENREEKPLKNKKTVEEGKVLRKKIRHLRREDERQAKSLTQDLKDIRESLSGVNNLNQIQTFDGHEFKTRGHRNYKETRGFYSDNSTRTEQRQGKHYEVKTDAKTTSKRCDNLEEGCRGRSSIKQKTTSPSRRRKTVRFEDDLGKKETERSRRQNETILSLSSIHLK